MLRRRSRDAGHFQTRIDLIIMTAIAGILLAIAIPAFLGYRAKRADACLSNLLRIASGSRPEKDACPWTGKPYPNTAECPEPDAHLEGRPRFVRLPDGAWRLEQVLPPYAGLPVDLGEGRTVVEETPVAVSLRLGHGLLAWGFTGFFLLILAGGIVSGVVGAVRSPETRGTGLFTASASLVLALGLAAFVGMTREYRIVRGSGTVTRVDRVWSWTRSTTTTDGVLGFVQLASPSWNRRKLAMVRAPGQEPLAFETVPQGRLDVSTWLNAVLTGSTSATPPTRP